MAERDPKKFDPARASSLDAAEREQYLPGEQLVALLELDGGETVLGYGAGTRVQRRASSSFRFSSATTTSTRP